ncbi:MAG: acyltransferase family protein [Desulfocapsaceae bacterium]
MLHRVLIISRIVVSIGIFMALKMLLSYVALSSFSKVLIDAEFDHDDVIAIYYSSGIDFKGFKEQKSKRSREFTAGQRSVQPVKLDDHVARRLRLDPGSESGDVKIYSIVLTSYYGKDIEFDHTEIYNSFAPGANIDAYTLADDHVSISATSGDPHLVLKDDLILPNFFIGTVLPLILAILFYVFLATQTLRTFPAFTDINNKKPSSGVNFGALDGIRGLAALLVLGQHSGVLRGSGIFGVWLFFCLSGFLLTSPFIRQPDRALSPAYLGRYITRRIKRIVPMYYVMITVTILFLGKFDVAIRHYLFLQADGHYWTVAQEMFFYLLLPLVMIANVPLARKRLWPSIIFIGLLAFVANRFITIDVIPLYGNNVTMRPMLGIFLTGICMAYGYHWLQDSWSELLSRPAVRRILSGCGLLLLVICLLISAHLVPGLEHIDAVTRSGWFGLGAGLLILLTLLSGNSLLDSIMNFLPLRAVGLVGFSFYLVHPMMISVVRGISTYFTDYYPIEIPLFIMAGLASYALSAFTYSYIERPFIKASRNPADMNHLRESPAASSLGNEPRY